MKKVGRKPSRSQRNSFWLLGGKERRAGLKKGKTSREEQLRVKTRGREPQKMTRAGRWKMTAKVGEVAAKSCRMDRHSEMKIDLTMRAC
jgi:hypothetical protein